jgi:phosphodiesterase/alkaline phosphatase D-like protein
MWGQGLHQWAVHKIKSQSLPTWLVSGGQFFAPPFKLKSGQQVNESFMNDYPRNFEILMADLRSSKSPVAFLSGDIHFSEIMKIESDFLGYDTFELTSSPLHAHIFRANDHQDEFFENKRRIKATKDYNFLWVESFYNPNSEWEIKVKSLGPNMKTQSFFEEFLKIKK